MRLTDIVIPYEEYIKNRVDCPKLLLEFDCFDCSKNFYKEKIVDHNLILQLHKCLGRIYKKHTVEVDSQNKRVIFYKRDKAIKYSIHILYTNRLLNRHFVAWNMNHFKCSDFEIIASYDPFSESYVLKLFYDDYNTVNEAFDDESYLKLIIYNFKLFIMDIKEKGNNKKTANSKPKPDNVFKYKEMLYGTEWKNNIKYESNSCIIIEQD